MKQFRKPAFLIILILLSNTFSLFAQQTDGRQVGINFRNVWFGSNIELLHRRQLDSNIWRRFDISISPSMQSHRISGQMNGIDVPNEFRFQSSNVFYGNFQIAKEKYNSLSSDLEFYHGRLFQIGYSVSSYKRTSAGSNELIYENSSVQSILLGLGYLAGIRYTINPKFAIGLDTDLKLQANVNLTDSESKVFSNFTRIISPGQKQETLLGSSFNLSQGPAARIWLLFNIN